MAANQRAMQTAQAVAGTLAATTHTIHFSGNQVTPGILSELQTKYAQLKADPLITAEHCDQSLVFSIAAPLRQALAYNTYRLIQEGSLVLQGNAALPAYDPNTFAFDLDTTQARAALVQGILHLAKGGRGLHDTARSIADLPSILAENNNLLRLDMFHAVVSVNVALHQVAQLITHHGMGPQWTALPPAKQLDIYVGICEPKLQDYMRTFLLQIQGPGFPANPLALAEVLVKNRLAFHGYAEGLLHAHASAAHLSAARAPPKPSYAAITAKSQAKPTPVPTAPAAPVAPPVATAQAGATTAVPTEPPSFCNLCENVHARRAHTADVFAMSKEARDALYQTNKARWDAIFQKAGARTLAERTQYFLSLPRA